MHPLSNSFLRKELHGMSITKASTAFGSRPSSHPEKGRQARVLELEGRVVSGVAASILPCRSFTLFCFLILLKRFGFLKS